MKKNTLFLLLWVLSGLFSFAQNSNDKVLMKIGDEEVTVGEFEYMYTKNLDLVKDPQQKDIDQYLNLFVNYKLQLIDARKKGLDKDWRFSAEYNKYKRELAKKYLSDEELINRLTREAYDRMKTDVKVAHLMVRLPSDALPEDTLQAWKKINTYYKKLRKGADFNEMAFKYSEDPSAKQNKGSLGWINVFHTVYPFETAAYNTPKGSISKPFRTKYGYHIVKVEDKRPATYRIQVAQIMLLKKKNAGEAEEKIREIYKKLKSGEGSFEAFARNFSDDKKTASKGGVMSPFKLREKTEVFEQKAFALKNPGDISEPFETRFAWHILKLIKKEPVPPFEKIKKELEEKVRRDERSSIGEKKLIQRLKKEIKIEEKGDLKDFYALIDDKFFQRRWKFPDDYKDKNKILFIINNDKKIKYNDFLAYLFRHQKNNPKLAARKKEIIKQLYESFKDKSLLDYYRENLDKYYPDYARIIKEYYEGLLLFNYKTKEIWEKAAKDTLGLETFFKQNREKYRTKAYTKVLYAETTDKKTAKKLLRALKKHPSEKELKEKFGDKALLKFRIKYASEVHIKKPVLSKKDNKYIVEGIVEEIPSHIPELNQIKGKVLSDYQQEIEKQLLKSLKEKYPVQINQENWDALRAKYKK